MSLYGYADSKIQNLPVFRLEDGQADPDSVMLEVDFESLSGIVPIARVVAVRGSLNRSHSVWLQLASDNSHGMALFWISVDGGRAEQDIEAKPGHDPVLGVDGEALQKALRASLGGESEPGSVRIEMQLRLLVNRTSQSRPWIPVSLTVNGVTSPVPCDAAVVPERISLNEADITKGAKAGEIRVHVPESIALSSAAGLEFEVEISCPAQLLASEVPLGLVPVGEAAGLVVAGMVTSASGARQDVQVFHFTVADPKALALLKSFTLQIVANATVLNSRAGTLSTEGHLEVRKFEVEIDAFWCDPNGERLEAWHLSDSICAIAVVTDKREWATITLDGRPKHVLRDDAETRLQLERFVISVPDRLDLVGAANIDELKLRIGTNVALGGVVVFDMVFMTGSGEEIVRLDDYWHDHLFSTTPVSDGQTAIASHDVDLAQPILERAVRAFLREEMPKSRDLPELECRVRVRKDNDPEKAGPLDWLPEIIFKIGFIQEKAFWPICIDVGMSATSIWIERPVPAEAAPVLRQEVLPVSLGAMHGELDRDHDEMPLPGSNGDGGFLLPSHIGIGSTYGIRTRYLPLSMGNLELALDDENSTRARLEQLGRHLDISVPFPSRSHMNDAGAIFVDDIKQRLTTGQPSIYIGYSGRQVWRRDGKTGAMKRQSIIEIHELLGDYLDELLSLYVSRFMLGYAKKAEIPVDLDDPEIRQIIGNPKIVLTHPAGIGEEQLGIYRLAARPLSRKISSRHFEPVVAGADDTKDDPVLILESVASARHAIDKMGTRIGDFCDHEGNSRLVSLDIGAGTFDVSILDLQSSGQVVDFDVVQSFGLGMAGEKLDSALIARIAAILIELFDVVDVQTQFGVLTPDVRLLLAEDVSSPQQAGGRLRSLLKRQIRTGKARLSAQVMREGRGVYNWNPEQTLDILIDENQEIEGLVEYNATGGRSRNIRYQLNGIQVCLHQLAAGETLPGEEGKQRGARLYLRLGSDAFDDRMWHQEANRVNCAQVVEALGTILPEIALEAAADCDEERPINVIVTGRTSLWPPLYSAISRTVENASCEARMLMTVPFSPQEMKIAVARGASLIARDSRNLQMRPAKRNPIAIIELSLRSEGADPSGKFGMIQMPTAVHYLDHDGGDKNGNSKSGWVKNDGDKNRANPTIRRVFRIHDRYVIGRAIPGLNATRLEKLQAVDPLAIVHSPLTGQAIQNRIKNNELVAQTSKTGRDRVTILLESEGQFRRRYNIDGDRISLQSSTASSTETGLSQSRDGPEPEREP